jgi:hypothetical protein
MLRTIVLRAVILTAFVPFLLFADAYDDLMKVQAAFQAAKSWHAEEHFSNGKTTIVEYSAPDRWRVQPTPDMTELVIGNDVYMVHNGRSTKLPFGGGMIRKTIQDAGFSVKDDIKQTARDLGMQTLDGQSVRVYSYTAHDIPVTLYIGPNLLPVQSVVQDKKMTTTIKYSKYNEPISIEPQ